jgi:polar amino acid transport system substrate-binding protein
MAVLGRALLGSRAPRTCAIALLLVLVAFPAAAVPRLALNSTPWPPYYLDDPARPGFARELLTTCVASAGYGTRFWPLPLEQLFSAMRSGVLDAHVVSHDPRREGFVLYGKVALFSAAYRPVVRAKSDITIASLADFDRLRLGHVRGLRYSAEFHEYVQARIAAGTVVQAETNEDLLHLLLAGKVDVFVGLDSTVRWLARTMHLDGRVAVLPYAVKSSDYFLGVSATSSRVKDKQVFLDAFDRCLLRLQQDGSYARLKSKYGL